MGTQKHTVYWFEDGSLILHVREVQFKVHHSFFKRLSPYFKSLDGAHLGDPTKTIDGIDTPVAYLLVGEDRGISAKDVETLLEHVYHDFPLSPDSPFERIAAVLRSSSPQQLDMPVVYAKARDHLDAIITTKVPPDIDAQQLLEALFIAKNFRLQSVLKVVLYQVMVSSNLDDDDPPPPSQTSPGSRSSSDPVPSENERRLTGTDIQLCKKLMTRVIDHFTPILFTPPATPHMACTDVFADTWMNLVIAPALEDHGVCKPIETLERLKQIEWGKQGLCTECVIEKRLEWEGEQESVWMLVENWLEEESLI